MAVRAFELRDSRKLRLDGTTLRYIVHGTNSDSAARTQLLATAPTTLGSWIRKPTVTLSYEGNFLFTGEVDYGPVVLSDLPPTTNPTGASGGAGGASPPPPAPADDDPLDSSVTFDIGSVTRRVYYSEETRHRIHRFPLNQADTPNFKKLVGVNGKNVEGYDRIEPKVELTVDREFEFVTVSYIDRIVDLVGSINQSDFPPLGKAEELLLLGVSGRLGGMSKDKSRPKLTYRFGRSKNRTNVPITTDAAGNDDIIAPTVKGWDHIWVLYEQDLGSQTITTQRALAAYVERIYPRRNFNNLGLYS